MLINAFTVSFILFIIAGGGKSAYKAERHEATAYPQIKQKSGT